MLRSRFLFKARLCHLLLRHHIPFLALRKGANSSFFGSGKNQAGTGGERRLLEIPQALLTPDIPPWLGKRLEITLEKAGDHPNQSAGKVEVTPLLNRGSLGPSLFPAPPCLSFPIGADAFPPSPARSEPLPVLSKAFEAQLQVKPNRARRIPALSASSWLLLGLTNPMEPRLVPLPKNNLLKSLPAS